MSRAEASVSSWKYCTAPLQTCGMQVQLCFDAAIFETTYGCASLDMSPLFSHKACCHLMQ